MAATISIWHALKVLLDPRFAAKTGLELLTIASGVATQAGAMEADIAKTSDPGIDVFWQDIHPLADRGKRRWNNDPRALEAVDCYGFHTTAVNGGFGAANYQIAPWRKTWDRLERTGFVHQGNPPSERRDGLVPWIPEGMSRDVAREAWAKLMAIRTRYLGLPYHSLSASRVEELIINHLLATYTWHGNGMNRYTWGHAMDDVWEDGELITDERVAHELAAIERVHKHVYDAGGRPRYCETHSQHARKPHDPGASYVAKVMVPFAKENRLIIRASAHSGNGKPLALPG